MACENGKTIDILRILKTAAPKQYVFDSQRYFEVLILSELDGTFELVNLIIWLFANQLT